MHTKKKFNQVFLLSLILTSLWGLYLWESPFRVIDTKSSSRPISEENFPPTQITPRTSLSEVWNDVWGRTGNNLDDAGNDIAVDSEGNIYVVGTKSDGLYSTYDIIVLKYNRQGIYEWNITWGENDGIAEHGNGIALDSEDNIYVGGNKGSSMLIVVFNSSTREELWNVTWGGSYTYTANDIDLDSEGNIFLAGSMNWEIMSQIYSDLTLVKFNNTGHKKWHKTYRSSNYDNYGYAVKVDPQNYIYVAGKVDSGSTPDKAYVAKYNQSGQKEWEHKWWTNTWPYHNEYFMDIGIDSENNPYLAGIRYDRSYEQSDILLVKYEGGTGTQLWNKSWGGSSNDDYGHGIEIDNLDNVYIIGKRVKLSPNFDDYILVKFDKTGTYQWYELFGDSRRQYGRAICGDSDANLYLTGIYDWGTSGNHDDVYTVKISLTPGSFVLNSNADVGNKDFDGLYNLSWGEANEAQNYSVYRAEKFITEINETDVDLLLEGNTNKTFTEQIAVNDTFYYIIVAYNDFGNTSSNCISVEVELNKPGEFSIYSDADPLDGDGIFHLSWDSSDYVKNYSIYESSSYISEINNTLNPPLYNGLESEIQLISGLNAGNHYFRVVAFNNQGNRTSLNCIKVTIQYSPGPFVLNPVQKPIYETEAFNLTWSSSELVDYYYVYQNNENITEIDETVFRYPVKVYTNMSTISGLPQGIYYFVLIAYNNYGNYTSNCIKVIIDSNSQSDDTPTNDDDDDENSNDAAAGGLVSIPFGSYFLLFTIWAIIFLLHRQRTGFRN